MGAVTTLLCNAALLLCFHLLLMHTSQAFKVQLRGGYDEKKVPLAVIVPDPTPELSGSALSPAPLAAPPPVYGGGGDDMRLKLPTERWRRGRGEVRRAAHHPPQAAHGAALAPSAAAPSRAPTAEAPAPAPESGSGGGGTAFIKSSPAVPVPRGVTDTATILPMPAPGEKRQETGAATWVEASCVLPLLLGLMVMMESFGI